MKKILFIAIIIVSTAFVSQAQNEDGGGMLKGSGSRFTVDIFSDMWQMDADTNITIKTINPGFNADYYFNIPLAGKFSLGLGIGIGTHNLNSNAMPTEEMKIDTAGHPYYTGNTVFVKIPEKINNKEIDYDINKIALAFIDIPLEFRFTSTTQKGSKIKFALGVKGGYLVNNHIKYKGTDFSDGEGDIKIKKYSIPNIESLRYGATVRLGFDRYHLFGYYSLSKLFKTDKGPEMYPISLGIGFAM